MNEPYFIFGWMNPISFSDEWTLVHFRMNKPYFIFVLTNPFSFSDLRTLFHFRRIEPSDKRIFGLTNPISFSDQRTFGTTNVRTNEPSEQRAAPLWNNLSECVKQADSTEKFKPILKTYTCSSNSAKSLLLKLKLSCYCNHPFLLSLFFLLYFQCTETKIWYYYYHY